MSSGPADLISKKSFEILPSDDYITIKLTGSLGGETYKQFEPAIPEIVKAPKDCVVNMEHCSDIPQPWIRLLMQVQSKLKTVNKQMRVVLANDKIKAIFKKEGVDSSLIIMPNLRAALAQFGLVKAKALDVNFINPFLSATLNVLKVQCSTEAKGGTPYTKGPSDKFVGDISGVIGLVSEAFAGSVVISFPEATFLKLISRMLGEDFKEMSKDIVDGAGELTNIIFGQAKVILNEKGYGIKTAIPSVVTGKDHQVNQLSKGPRVVIPFESDIGNFGIEICVSE